MTSITQGTDVPKLREGTLEKTVWFDPDELDHLPFEEREHSDADIDHFQRTIYDYNRAQPIVVDDECNIVAGRGRVEAARLADANEVLAIPLSPLSSDDHGHYVETMIRFRAYVGWASGMLETDLQHLLVIEALLKAGRGDTAVELQ